MDVISMRVEFNIQEMEELFGKIMHFMGVLRNDD